MVKEIPNESTRDLMIQNKHDVVWVKGKITLDCLLVGDQKENKNKNGWTQFQINTATIHRQ
jgi:hypothetical protein